MKVYVLTENTALSPEFDCEHGLSLYIETQKHKILFDMGQTNVFLKNAEKLGVDLKAVDVAVLSHGHYDHGGGLPEFLKINKTADIYMSRRAFEPHYNGFEKYIGLDPEIKKCERIIYTDDEYVIDDELKLFSCNKNEYIYPLNSFGLNKKTDGKFYEDDFLHEQYLQINDNGKKVLISGCSHKGILNIESWFSPDILIGGFHFMKLDPEGDGKDYLLKAANFLKATKTKYYTCHCTGVLQYEFLKGIMGEKLSYISAGTKFSI